MAFAPSRAAPGVRNAHSRTALTGILQGPFEPPVVTPATAGGEPSLANFVPP